MRFRYAYGDRPIDGYTIQRGVGAGGFGEVYHAVSDAGKEVAIKVIRADQFETELRGVAQCLNLKHPNLISVYDLRTNPEGDHFVIMEYVNGESLADAIDRNPDGMPLEQVAQWFEGLARGVAHLHKHGIVHRDLKPQNIFREDGIVKVGDYGLSKHITASRRSGHTTTVGTVHYMAPEVGSGRYGHSVDIFAAGVILYEMLTGRPPFDGESVGEILMRIATEDPDLTLIPQQLRPVLKRALEKDPAKRYQTMDEFLADFRQAIGAGASPHLTSRPLVPPLTSRPHPATASTATKETPRDRLAQIDVMSFFFRVGISAFFLALFWRMVTGVAGTTWGTVVFAVALAIVVAQMGIWPPTSAGGRRPGSPAGGSDNGRTQPTAKLDRGHSRAAPSPQPDQRHGHKRDTEEERVTRPPDARGVAPPFRTSLAAWASMVLVSPLFALLAASIVLVFTGSPIDYLQTVLWLVASTATTGVIGLLVGPSMPDSISRVLVYWVTGAALGGLVVPLDLHTPLFGLSEVAGSWSSWFHAHHGIGCVWDYGAPLLKAGLPLLSLVALVFATPYALIPWHSLLAPDRTMRVRLWPLVIAFGGGMLWLGMLTPTWHSHFGDFEGVHQVLYMLALLVLVAQLAAPHRPRATRKRVP